MHQECLTLSGKLTCRQEVLTERSAPVRSGPPQENAQGGCRWWWRTTPVGAACIAKYWRMRVTAYALAAAMWRRVG